jgi:hypothetical protein
MIPDKKLGDKYKQKNFNIRNVFIYYHEAMTTPCTLYCNKLTARDRYNFDLPYKVFYKIGITATRHLQDLSDTSDTREIKYRIIKTRDDFQRRNGGLLQLPLFVVHSNVFNCVLLENALHKSIVFNGAISRMFRYFGGITECSKYLDFDMIEQIRKRTLLHNSRNQEDFYRERERFFKRHNVLSFQELDRQQKKDFVEMSNRFLLNNYDWKMINKKEVQSIRSTHKEIVRAYQNTLDLRSFQNWIRLHNLQTSQDCLSTV